MIKAEILEVVDFRGIKRLKLDFKGNNFAVCGRNGTGKSGIVDALEFVLMGNISRLSGRGTGDISVKNHAPHVDCRNDPEKARVILTAFIPSLNKRVTIERCVKNPEIATICPADVDVIEVMRQVALHPEFALSRRELIRYVLSTPGDRAKEVQTLLRLDQLEDVRTVLQKVANACEKEIKPLLRERDQAREQLIKALEISNLTDSKIILEAVNQRRAVLGLAAIEQMTASTSFKDGLQTSLSGKSQVLRTSRPQATIDVQQAEDALSALTSYATRTACDAIIQQFTSLKEEPAILNSVARETLLKNALTLIEREACPVCDTEWNPVELRKLITDKIQHLKHVALKRKSIENALAPIHILLHTAKRALQVLSQHGRSAKPTIDTTPLTEHATGLESFGQQLDAFLPIDASITSLKSLNEYPAVLKKVIDEVKKFVDSLPEPTKQQAARDFLILTQERLQVFQSLCRRLKQAQENALVAKTIYTTYADVSTNALNTIYKQVELDFSELYQFINHEDESGFDAHLLPSVGKLGFDVNFYGRGYFPPGAYHSEGHQDGMGLCLYLALSKHLLKDNFLFAVLDDVLMSVDAGHRREVCKLLKEQFPNTQFVLTTHDEVWLRHMKSAGLIAGTASVLFRKWSVEEGPSEWHERDIWTEIESSVDENRILIASTLLRNYLEYVGGELCHRLRASVEHRADGHFQLGDVLPQAIAQYRQLLKAAKNAARSWSNNGAHASIDAREKAFSAIAEQSNVEKWQINPAIHYNEWANLTKQDFAPVVAAMKELLTSLRCPGCSTFLYVLPARGERNALRCECGETSLNLRKQ